MPTCSQKIPRNYCFPSLTGGDALLEDDYAFKTNIYTAPITDQYTDHVSPSDQCSHQCSDKYSDHSSGRAREARQMI